MATGFAYVPATNDGCNVYDTAPEYDGYKDTVKVIREMRALQADWDWATDWIDYNVYNDASNIYMSGVYKALEFFNITY